MSNKPTGGRSLTFDEVIANRLANVNTGPSALDVQASNLLGSKLEQVNKAKNTKMAAFTDNELSMSLHSFRAMYPNATSAMEESFLAQQKDYLSVTRNQSMAGDIATDLGISFGDRLPQTGAALLGMAADSVGADSVSDSMWDYVAQQQAESLESEKDYSRSLVQTKQKLADFAAARKARYMADGEMSVGETLEDFFSTGVQYAANPSAIVSEAVKSSESILTTVASGGFAGAAAKAATKQAIKTKMGKEALQRAGANRAADMAARKAAKRAGVVTTGLTEGGSNAIQARDEIMGIPDEVIATSEDFKELRAKNPELSFAEAKKQFANEGARDTAIISGLLAAGIGKLSGASDAASTALVKGATKDSIGKVALKGAGKEALEEVGQSAAGQIASNYQVSEGDESKQWLEDVGHAAAVGGLSGGVMGGTVSGAGRAVTTGMGKVADHMSEEKVAARGQAKRVKAAKKEAAKNATGIPEIDALMEEALVASTVEAASGSEKQLEQLKSVGTPAEQELAKTPQEAPKQSRKAILNLQATKDAMIAKGESTEAVDSVMARMQSIGSTSTQTAPKGTANQVIKEKEAKLVEGTKEKDLSEAEVDALFDDLIGDLSFQINPEDDIDADALNSFKAVAEAAGVSADRLKGIDRILNINKTSAEVKNNILVGDSEWRGAKQYLSQINTGLLHGAEQYTANTYAELSRFSDEMQHKAKAYRDALKASEISGKEETPLRADGTPYLKTDKTNAWVKAGKTSETLVDSIESDAATVAETLATAETMVQENWSSADLTKTIESLGLTPTQIANAQVERLLTEVGTEEAAALIESANASDEGWTQTKVQQADAIIKAAPTKTEPVASEVTEPTQSKPNPTLTGSGRQGKKNLDKDQGKSDQATKFIGFGRKGSSTEGYSNDWGTLANTGEYTSDDVVFVSVNGGKSGPTKKDAAATKAELDKALKAGATIITDNKQNRERDYNLKGEGRIADYLTARGYEETDGNGKWVPAATETTTPQVEEEAATTEPEEENVVDDSLVVAEYANAVSAAEAAVSESEATLAEMRTAEKETLKSLKETVSSNQTLKKYIASKGGLDREAFGDEVPDAQYNDRKGIPPNQRLWAREGSIGITPDGLRELLQDEGHVIDSLDDVYTLVNAMQGEPVGSFLDPAVDNDYQATQDYLGNLENDIMAQEDLLKERKAALEELTTNPVVSNEQMVQQVTNFFDVASNTDTISEGNAKKLAQAAGRLTLSLDTKEAIRYTTHFMAGKVKKENFLNNTRYSPASIAAAEQLIKRAAGQINTDTKSAGQKSLEEHLDTPSGTIGGLLPFTKGFTEADEKSTNRNEFKEEAKVGDNTLLSNNPESSLTDMVQGTEAKTFAAKIDALVTRLGVFATNRLRKNLSVLSDKNVGYHKKKGHYQHLLNMGAKGSFDSGVLHPMLAKAVAVSAGAWASTSTLYPTEMQIKAFLGLSSQKAPVNERILGMLKDDEGDIRVGDIPSLLVRELGTNALRLADISFTGEHANTSTLMRDALGELALEYLIDLGVIHKIVYSTKEVAAMKAMGAKFSEGTATTYKISKKHPMVAHRVKKDDEPVTPLVGEKEFYSEIGQPSYTRHPVIRYTPKSSDRVIGSIAAPSPKLKEGMDTASKTPHYLNERMGSWFDSLGDLFKVAAGYTEVAPDTKEFLAFTLNKIVGKNLTIERDILAYEEFRKSFGEVGTEPYGEPFHYPHVPLSNNRITTDVNGFDYQSSKIARFLSNLSPVTMTITSIGSSEPEARFEIAVAQGLNIKVDKLRPDSARAKLHKFTHENVGLIEAAKAMNAGTATDAQKASLVEYARGNEQIHTLMALGEYAAYLTALENHETEMVVTLPVEWDGRNNGPITFLLAALATRLNSNSVTRVHIEKYLKKGGILSKDSESSASLIEEGLIEGLYEEAQHSINTTLKSVLAGLKGNPETQEEYAILQAQLYLKSLSKMTEVNEEGEFEATRDETKPVIVESFYGAGDNALRNSDASSILRGAYGLLQDRYSAWVNSDNLPEKAQDALWGSLVEAYSNVHSKLGTASRTSFNPPALTKENVEDALNRDLYAIYEANLLNELYTQPHKVKVGEPTYKYSDVKMRAIRSDNDNFLMTQFQSAYDLMKTITNAMDTIGLFSDVVRQQELEKVRTEEGVSKFEEVSTAKLKEVNATIMGIIPTYSLTLHSDKENYTDAIPAVSSEPSAIASDRSRLGLTDANKAPYTETRAITSIGSGAVPALALPIADAVPFANMSAESSDTMLIFDGLFRNALNDIPAVNKHYLDSLRDNNVASIVYDAFIRGSIGRDRVFDIDTHSFKEGVTPRQMKQVLFGTRRIYNEAAAEVNARYGYGPKHPKYVPIVYSDIDYVAKIEGIFKSATDINAALSTGKFPINRILARALRQNEATLAELSNEPSIGKVLPEIFPDGVTMDQFGALDGKTEVYDTADSTRLNPPVEPEAEPEIAGPVFPSVEQQKRAPFWQEEQAENYHPKTDYNPWADSWFKHTDMNAILRGKNTKTARGFSVKLNQLVDKSSIAENKSLATFYKKVLNRYILAPALAKLAAAGKLPNIVVTNETGLREIFKGANGKTLKNILRSKGIAHSKNGGAHTIYLNESKGGVSAETLFHELVHAVLDHNITTVLRGNKAAALLLKQMKDIAATELAENRINPDIATYNEKELFAWGLTNLDVITTLARNEQREVAQSKATGWSGFAGALLNLLKKAIKTISGTKVHEDSVLAYLVDTAASMARRTPAQVETAAEQVSFQMEAENTFNQAPEETFNKLLQSSTADAAHQEQLKEVFYREILAVQNSKDSTLSEYAKNAVDALTELQANGTYIGSSEVDTVFSLDATESYLFDNYRHIIGAGLDGLSPSSQAISNLYTRAKKQIKPKDFLLHGEVESDPVAMAIATQKWNTVFQGATRTGHSVPAGNVQGKRNRSMYMAEFVALLKVSPQFREVMSKHVLVSARNLEDQQGIQAWLSKLLERVTTFLSGAGTGTHRQRTYKSKIDKLARNLTAAEFRAKSKIETRTRSLLDVGSNVYSTYSKASGALHKRVMESTTAAGIKHGTSMAYNLAKVSIQGKHNAAQAARMKRIQQAAVHGALAWVPEVVEDVRNITDGNKLVKRLKHKSTRAIAGYRDGMIKAAKSTISDWLGKSIANKFVSAGITDTVISAEIAALKDTYSLDQIAALYADPVLLQEAIATYRAKLGNTVEGNMLNRAATSLGFFMVHGIGSEAVTFPNPDVIVQRVGESVSKNLSSARKNVDILSTLVAMEQTKDSSKKAFVDTFKANPEGITAAINLQHQHILFDVTENLKGKDIGRLKGRTDVLRDPAKDIRIVDAVAAESLFKDGYKYHRDISTVHGPMVVMVSDTNGQGTFLQGAMATTIGNQQGFKNLDGRSLSGGYDDYDQMQSQLPRAKSFYNAHMNDMGRTKNTHTINQKGVLATHSNGSAMTLESVLPRKELDMLLGVDARFEQVLPRMYGRTAEISRTDVYNKEVNQALLDTYLYDKQRGNLQGYIEIGPNAPTKRGKEAYRMTPPAARAHMKEIWGDKVFVKQSLFTTIYGYRKASLSNVLKQNSDSPKWAQYLIRKTLGIFFSDRTLIRAFSKGGAALSEFVSYVKDWIVVRGIKVLIDNVISNTVELVLFNDGMTIIKAIKYQLEGIRLAKKYQEDEARLRRISVELLGKTGNERRVLLDESLQLQEELAKNNAGSLIDKGFMSAIVEDVESSDNVFSYGNRLGTAFDSKLTKLPESVQWVAGTLAASRDSSWYQTAYKFTQLSDFSSRYAMYRNAQEQGEVTDDTMDKIADAFVNYDLPSNKYIQYLGDMGMVWFLKYFMRIQKVIIEGTIENPRKAAEFAAMGAITGIHVASPYDAFFLTNPITNKLGLLNYTEKGLESLPGFQLMELF